MEGKIKPRRLITLCFEVVLKTWGTVSWNHHFCMYDYNLTSEANTAISFIPKPHQWFIEGALLKKMGYTPCYTSESNVYTL